MNYLKNKLIELGFSEEIGYIPYLIYYKYKSSIKIRNHEYKIIIILYSNGTIEILKEVKIIMLDYKSFLIKPVLKEN